MTSLIPSEIVHVCAWCHPQTDAINVSHTICEHHKRIFLADAAALQKKPFHRQSAHQRRHKHALQRLSAPLAPVVPADILFPQYVAQKPDDSLVTLSDSAFLTAARESWREAVSAQYPSKKGEWLL